MRPTFTPVPANTGVPTAVPTAVVTVTPVATSTVVAAVTLGGQPAVTVAAREMAGTVAAPTATVVPEGVPVIVASIVVDGREITVPGEQLVLPGGKGVLRVERLAVFPFQFDEPPRFLTHGDVAWPAGDEFISRGTRYVYWAVKVNDSEAQEGWEMPVYFRWVDRALFAATGQVMVETPAVMSGSRTTVYQGVGRGAPGFWRPGGFSVYLLDGSFRELLRQDFDVR